MSTVSSDRPGIIYLAVNRVNQKAYVGQTATTLRRRIMEHIRGGARQAFDVAIGKYGIDSFDIAVLEQCTSRADLNAAEVKWIAAIGSRSPNGYNLSDGGKAFSGVLMTPETRAKIGLAKRGLPSWNAGMKMGPEWSTPEKIEKRSHALRERYKLIPHHMNGKKIPENVRLKMSEAQKGKNAGSRNGMYGRPSLMRGRTHTAESNAKNRAAAMARWSDPEYRARYMASSQKGKPWSAARRAAQQNRSKKEGQ